ncbi:hypothetical protein OIU76_015243 [Salix suchowensis]|nr:hypothetical protein OIU76_015243 [Salix suchowensis]
MDNKRVKGPWSPEEDELLKHLVIKHGPRNWTMIARAVPGRSGKSCRLRWCNQLSPEVEHRAFSREEDEIVINAHASDAGLPVTSSMLVRENVPAVETGMSNNDGVSTELTLSTPGMESGQLGRDGVGAKELFTGDVEKTMTFAPELLAVMQEMIRKEVRNYMVGIGKKSG